VVRYELFIHLWLEVKALSVQVVRYELLIHLWLEVKALSVQVVRYELLIHPSTIKDNAKKYLA
jgi:hypothetical protein